MKEKILNKIADCIMVIVFAIILGFIYKISGFETAMLYAVIMIMYRLYRVQSIIEEK